MLCYCNPIFMQNMYHMYDSQSSNELTQLLINHKQLIPECFMFDYLQNNIFILNSILFTSSQSND